MSSRSYDIGNEPPQVSWTLVRGDTAAFKVYVTDDGRLPLDLSVWTIEMQVKRGSPTSTLVLDVAPSPDPDDLPGEFTVSLTAAETRTLETGDVFDIQLSNAQDSLVWTVAQGRVVVIEDITDRP
jgi:hypothetical protein